MLALRFSDPSLRRSNTLLLLGDPSLDGDVGVEDMGLGDDDTGVIGGRVFMVDFGEVRYCRVSLVNRSLISSVWLRVLISNSF